MDKQAISFWQENSRKFNYLHFLYNATHPQPFSLSPPYQVYIEPTNVCNLRCSHCPQSTMRREKQYIKLELVEKIVKDISMYIPFVDLYLQGEPLLHPEIVDIVKIVKSHGLLPRITTNATMLKKEMSKALIKSGLDKIQFSMSGASKKTYDSIYHGARFERTLNKVLDFLELNAEAGFPVHTRSVFVEEEKTSKDKGKYLEVFNMIPIDDVYVSPLINMFGWNEELDIIDLYEKTPRNEWPVCKGAWRNLGVNADGTVRACVFDYDSRYLIGDANEDNVMDIWNSERMMSFRKAHIEHRQDELEELGFPLCMNCSQPWPTSNLDDTGLYLKDFAKEAEDFFSNENHIFKAKYVDMDEKRRKLEYLKKNKNKWLEMVLADLK